MLVTIIFIRSVFLYPYLFYNVNNSGFILSLCRLIKLSLRQQFLTNKVVFCYLISPNKTFMYLPIFNMASFYDIATLYCWSRQRERKKSNSAPCGDCGLQRSGVRCQRTCDEFILLDVILY